jgi:hypothetical protein
MTSPTRHALGRHGLQAGCLAGGHGGPPLRHSFEICQRWLAARLLLAVVATVWLALFDPRALVPAVLTLPLALGAALDRPRSRAWLDSHAFALSALTLSLPSPFLITLGAAFLPSTALSLFAPRLLTRLGPVPRALTAMVLAATLALTLSPAPIASSGVAVGLAAFFSLRPLAALGEVLRALGLHHGPADPLLAWRPLGPSVPGARA